MKISTRKNKDKVVNMRLLSRKRVENERKSKEVVSCLKLVTFYTF